MDGTQHGLSGEAVPVSIELQPAGEVLSLPTIPDELHNGDEELLVAVVLLLLLQHQHEEEAEAGLHHHPVHHTRQVDVSGQEHKVLPLVEWSCHVKQTCFGETKDITVLDISLETDADTEVVQFIIQTPVHGCLAEKIHVVGIVASVQLLHVCLSVSSDVETDA